MTLYATPKLSAYAALGILGPIAGLLLAQPVAVLLGAPFLLALATGLALVQVPTLDLTLGVTRERVIEGADVHVEVSLTARTVVERLEVLLRLPPGLKAPREARLRQRTLAAGEAAVLHIPIYCERWGGYTVGEIYLRAHDRFGFFRFEGHLNAGQPLRVYPRFEALRSLPVPAQSQLLVGNVRSRAKGEGIEFADVRPYEPGDPVRRMNWRRSTQRSELFVNEFYPERNVDVVLLLDTFAHVEGGDEGTHLVAIRGAATLAQHYLDARHRVGVVGFGGIVQWLRPGMGARQRYRIVEALIDTDLFFSLAWKGVNAIPRSTLPARSLVIAFTPLLDGRTIDALLDLRARGFDLAVIEVSPLPLTKPDPSDIGRLAFQLWVMEREALRYRFGCVGIPVAIWEIGQPFEAVLREVHAFRRYAHQARA